MARSVSVVQTTDEGLHRALTRWNALAVVISGVVGTGILIRPASIAQLVHTGPAMMAVWLVAGLLTMGGALTYAELAARLPRSGGEYAFLRVTLGEFPAFLFGWMRLTLGATTISALAVSFTVFLGDLFPLGSTWWSVRLSSASAGEVDVGARQLIAVLVIAALALLNVRGVAQAGRFQSWVTTLKVLGLGGLIVAIFVFAPGHGPDAGSSAFTEPAGQSAFGAALLAALASFNGWTSATMLGGEIKDPARSLPWALIVGIGIVMLVYLAANLAYLRALSMDDILAANSTAHATASSVASRAASAALGPKVATLMSALFLVSALGTLHCNLLAVPRVFYAMAHDGLMPQVISRIAPRARTPYVAIVALATIAAVLAVLGSYDRLANMATLGSLIFFALNAFGYLYARGRLPAPPGRSTIPLWIPSVFLGATLLLIVTLIARGMTEVVAALAMLVLGIPAFAFLKWRQSA